MARTFDFLRGRRITLCCLTPSYIALKRTSSTILNVAIQCLDTRERLMDSFLGSLLWCFHVNLYFKIVLLVLGHSAVEASARSTQCSRSKNLFSNIYFAKWQLITYRGVNLVCMINEGMFIRAYSLQLSTICAFSICSV